MSTENWFYCNALKLSASPYDFNLKFLRIASSRSVLVQNESDGEKAVPTVVAETDVVMSPSHAKSIVVMLYRAIQEYEALYGVVPLPPEKREEFEKLFGKSLGE
jgi:hypothetical protein